MIPDVPRAHARAGVGLDRVQPQLKSRPRWAIVPAGLVSSPDFSEIGDADLARLIMASPPGAAKRAESELCLRFGRRVMAYGRRHLVDETAALDLTQRVLLVTLEKLRARDVREPERIASFILGVARTLSREAQRKRFREPTMLPADELPDLVTIPLLEPLASEQLAGCLRKLEERERSVVVLSFFDQLSAAEIGHSLGLSAGNIRVMRHRAIQRLRRCMRIDEVAS